MANDGPPAPSTPGSLNLIKHGLSQSVCLSVKAELLHGCGTSILPPNPGRIVVAPLLKAS